MVLQERAQVAASGVAYFAILFPSEPLEHGLVVAGLPVTVQHCDGFGARRRVGRDQSKGKFANVSSLNSGRGARGCQRELLVTGLGEIENPGGVAREGSAAKQSEVRELLVSGVRAEQIVCSKGQIIHTRPLTPPGKPVQRQFEKPGLQSTVT